MARTESETQDGGKEGEERNLSSLCVPGTFLNASHAGGRYFFKVLQGWRVTFGEVELFRGLHVLTYRGSTRSLACRVVGPSCTFSCVCSANLKVTLLSWSDGGVLSEARGGKAAPQSTHLVRSGAEQRFEPPSTWFWLPPGDYPFRGVA